MISKDDRTLRVCCLKVRSVDGAFPVCLALNLKFRTAA
jgi:hypothetical protein